MSSPRRGAGLVACLLIAACSGNAASPPPPDASAAPQTTPAPPKKAPPPPDIPAETTMEFGSSYATSWAQSQRSSRVTAPYRRLGAFARVAPLSVGQPLSFRGVGVGRPSRIDFVLVEPSGRHVVVRYDTMVDILTTAGELLYRATLSETGPLVVEPWRLFTMFGEWGFDGAPGPLTLSSSDPAAKVWAGLRIGTRWTQVFTRPRTGFHENVQEAAVIAQQSEATSGGGRAVSTPLWVLGHERDVGTGAVGRDGRVAIALGSRRFVVAGPDLGGALRPAIHVDVPLRVEAYDLSILEDGYALLVAHDRPAGDPSSESYARQVEGRRFNPRTSGLAWHTELVVLDSAGHERFALTVPFEVRQPPIDGGGGQVWLAGGGVALIEKGNVRRAEPSARTQLATAYGDGALAVVDGGRLRVLRADGETDAEIALPEGETTQAPPAIDATSGVWVATDKGLYVARP